MRIHADDGAVQEVTFALVGGSGYVPVVISGIKDLQAFTARSQSGQQNGAPPSGWQTGFDQTARTWSVTYTVAVNQQCYTNATVQASTLRTFVNAVPARF